MNPKIKLIEDRKSKIKTANLLLPSLLTEEELIQINGGGPFTCEVVSCGFKYSITVCHAHLSCPIEYTNGGKTCHSQYTETETCPSFGS